MQNEPGLAIWGGPECTINRVGEEYFDQFQLSGHAARPEDLERFAALGLRTLRYPVLWEQVSPGGTAESWTWTDERLAELYRLGMTPIVGLVHHGSGPPSTSLLDPAFPEKLARHAERVARRYPHIVDYTPVNEPLTTARFSGLYGHWYPHQKSDVAFVRALLNQCKGVVLSMRAIRRVNPAARLVQTEDIGIVRSTDELAYQAAFENSRRFLSLDLLVGKVDGAHPLFGYLRRSGASERELRWFTENPCPPDLLGMNYYVTSERFLDGRVHLYPEPLVGGNRWHRYADVEAVRVCNEGLVGPRAILRQLWTRYRLPVAITEAHLGCTVEQQVRWLQYVVEEAGGAFRDGVDVRAVTAWALLGAYGWSNLVTTRPETYEAGVFSVNGGAVEETMLSEAVSTLCRGESPPVPAGSTGWWGAPARLLYPAYTSRPQAA